MIDMKEKNDSGGMTIAILISSIFAISIYFMVVPYAAFKCENFGLASDWERGGTNLLGTEWSMAECYDGRVVKCEQTCANRSKLGNCKELEMVCEETK